MKLHVNRLFGLALAVLFISVGSVAQVGYAEDTTGDTSGGAGFGEETIRIARGYDDGGGYIWKGSTGVSETLTHRGQTILKKQPVGTYCCGFTLQVAIKLVQNHGLFDDMSYDEVKRFQRQWYGSTEGSGETQCTLAMELLGVGHAVSHDDARPGDFANYWRTKSGHSVIFLNWVADDEGNRIGIHYRSSQTKTDGIGDRTEYFKGHGGEVDPNRLYICRFNEPQDEHEEDADKDPPEEADDNAVAGP